MAGSSFLPIPDPRGRTPFRGTTYEDTIPMHRWTPRSGLLRGGLIAIVLTMCGALAVYASLPPASDDGQARAQAGAANGQADEDHAQADEHSAGNTGEGQSTAMDRLAENQDRLFAHLNDVLDRLSSNEHVPSAATDALQHVIDMLGGDIGLNRAMDAVGGDTGAPELPEQATNHPGRP
jgi:hypothetical protein